jgi:hypothetical protein
MIVEADPRRRQTLQGFSRSSRRYPALEIRQLYPQSARVTIVDDREVLIFPVPNGHARGVQEVAIWTDNPDFIRSQSLYFDGMWERAGPATWHPPTARGSGRSRPSSRSRPATASSDAARGESKSRK